MITEKFRSNDNDEQYLLLQSGESHRSKHHGREPTDRFLSSTLTTDSEEAVVLLIWMGDCGAISCRSLVR